MTLNSSPFLDADQQQILQAVPDDLQTLALLHDRELAAEVLQTLKSLAFPTNLGLLLHTPEAEEARKLLEKAFLELPAPIPDELINHLAADYADIYLTHRLRASPLESVWLDEDHLACQEPMFQVRAFYHRFGYDIPDWRKRPHDHLVYQLQFLARLIGDGAGDGELLRAALDFLDEHPLRWVERFAALVASRCRMPFYAGLAILTAVYLHELRGWLATLSWDAGRDPPPTPASGNAEQDMPTTFMSLCPDRW